MMVALSSTLRRFRRRTAAEVGRPASEQLVQPVPGDEPTPVDIAPNDPLLAYLQSASGAVDVEALELDSPALAELKAAGVKLAVPLVSQGELIGVLNLGPRRSEQEYSSDDRRLLDNLAAQAAPALRVGQLVRQQQAEARTRQRFEQELEVARLIQQNFLPKELPELSGWQVAACYQPAREVGGDFYDVIALADGQVGFVIGDVTDKGVPAALVMAATRSVLRASAQRLIEPGQVLERVNEHLCPDMPAKMFVTCLYGVLDPATGRFRFANAGHDLPYVKTAEGSVELRARGMPLGLMSGMTYEEHETLLAPGDSLLLHSDGIVEAHDPQGQMFGFPRLKELVARYPGGGELIELVLADLHAHTGPGAEQEDDITMVVLQREPAPGNGRISPKLLAEFEVPSVEGNERLALERVAGLVGPLGLPAARLRRLETAVAEATMNAMEHGNSYRADRPVTVRVYGEPTQVRVEVADLGGVSRSGTSAPGETEVPDLEAKLAGLQRPRGWGLFLIKNMVDEARETSVGERHIVELVMHLEAVPEKAVQEKGDDDDDT
ncbi:GAF domain-containing protein [Kribbella soli]|uniref:GAF domain-containing protein n=2 Tax=Kribbella soli TaxID=1124743 RepID=A0A4R0H4T0_9ACTN|nr:GAF domain-containing protein [Kribbella soli]